MPVAVLVLLLAVAVLRGAAYLPVSWSLEELSLVQVVTLEVTVAAVAIGLLLALTGRLGLLIAELRARPVLALRLTLLQTVIPFALIAVGLQHVPTGTAAVLVCAAPLFATTIAGALDVRDRPTPVQGLGLLGGLAGVGLVVGVEALSTTEQALGALALLLTALVYVFAGLTFRTHYRETPVMISAGVGILPALPFALPVLALSAPAELPRRPRGRLAAAARHVRDRDRPDRLLRAAASRRPGARAPGELPEPDRRRRPRRGAAR